MQVDTITLKNIARTVHNILFVSTNFSGNPKTNLGWTILKPSALHAEHLLFQIQIIQIIVLLYIRRATMVTEGYVAASFHKRHNAFKVGLDCIFASN